MRNKSIASAVLLSAAIAATALSEPDPDPSMESAAAPARPVITLATNAQGQWNFYLDGEPFPLRGVGGASAPGLLEKLKEAGGNCVRTWGIETLAEDMGDGERFIDRAHRLGIKVVPGIWVEHERHGFDYGDEDMIRKQRERVLAGIRQYRDHPAIIAWCIGNEMEGPASPTGSIPVFREVEELVKRVKQEDSSRPVMSIIAFNPGKISNVMAHCPSIDILGVNSYGAAAGAGPALKAAGWTKPFAVTEFGVRGFWEVATTPWGAPLEPTSHEKARTYYATHTLVTELNEGRELCLGTFAFLWGWKQEKTATWFGMFLPTLEKLPSVDAMAKVWTGAWPENRCPTIHAFTSEAYAATVAPGRIVEVQAEVSDANGDAMTFDWQVLEESRAQSEGGDAEESPSVYPVRFIRDRDGLCTFISPDKPGDYRLFLVVRDGRGGAATANFPFHVTARTSKP